MKTHRKLTTVVCLLMILTAATSVLKAQETNQKAETAKSEASKSEGDKAWEEFISATQQRREPPEEWKTKRPSREEIMEWNRKNGIRVGELASQARKFYSKYSDHPMANEARTAERSMVTYAVNMGDTNAMSRFFEIQQERSKDPSLSQEERLEMEWQTINATAMSKKSQGPKAVEAELEKGILELHKKYPKHPAVFQLLLDLANSNVMELGARLSKVILAGDPPLDVKEGTELLLKRVNLLNKPLDLKYKALDGREVDVQKMKGKVVLVDFWATWCGPCVAEIPNLKSTYEKLHSKGFEIVGVSSDVDEEALKTLLAKEKMTWPQYFDPSEEKKIGRDFGISTIPTMWLLDKKGILRDLDAREDLEKKVAKLLSE